MQTGISAEDFHRAADPTLERWAEALETADPEGKLDVALENGILTITIEADGRQFVLNKHSPMRQLWLSSPVSGAYHCNPEGTRWTATNGANLATVLRDDLATAAGIHPILT